MSTQDASRNGAAPRMKSPDRTQIDPNPKRIDELIDADHPARLVWELVQDLDLTPVYEEIKATEGHAGRPAIDPRILVSLWILATLEHIGSARELHRRCYDCDPFKWLRGGVDVNYHTLSDFRTGHQEWLRQVVIQQIATLRAEDLVHLDKLGQDGMRVRASAGNSSFKRAETLERLLEEAEAHWDHLEEEFQQSQCSPRQLAAQRRAARERIERLQQAREEVQQVAQQREQRKKGNGPSARASTTDPAARRTKMADGGYRPAYNVQFVSDLDSLVITAANVINVGSDIGQLEPMVVQLETEQDALPEGSEYFVDGGFVRKEDIERVGQRGVTVFAPLQDEERQRNQGKDPHAPKRGDTPHVAAWRQRMGTKEAKTKYPQRSKAEWPNAGCRNRGLQQFLVRGLEKVNSVVLWHVLTHNLFRMVALRAQQANAAT